MGAPRVGLARVWPAWLRCGGVTGPPAGRGSGPWQPATASSSRPVRPVCSCRGTGEGGGPGWAGSGHPGGHPGLLSLWEVGFGEGTLSLAGFGGCLQRDGTQQRRPRSGHEQIKCHFISHPKKKCRKEEVSVDLIAHIKNLPGETEPFPPESVQTHRDTSSFSFSFSSSSSSSSAPGPGWGRGHHLPPPQGAPVPWAPCCQPQQRIPCPGLSCPAPAPPARCPHGATHTSCPGAGAGLGVGRWGRSSWQGWPGAVSIRFEYFRAFLVVPFPSVQNELYGHGRR